MKHFQQIVDTSRTLVYAAWSTLSGIHIGHARILKFVASFLQFKMYVDEC